MTIKKPNCYECKYRGGVPGSAHSSCNHPAFADDLENPYSNLMSIFAGVGRVPPFQAHRTTCKVTGSPHGKKMGWFNHPFNFDPVWLETCEGFEPKENQ